MVSPNSAAVSKSASLYLSEASELAGLAHGYGIITDGIIFSHDDEILTGFWRGVQERLAGKPEHTGFIDEQNQKIATEGPQALNCYYQGVQRINWVNIVLEREGVRPQRQTS